jgi:hypothetical protein
MKNMTLFVFAGIPVSKVAPLVTRKIPEEIKLPMSERKRYEYIL